jgi:hydroxyacylglutathione hydrolase
MGGMIIHAAPGFMSTAFVVESACGLVLVDAGFIGHGRVLSRLIRRIGRTVGDVKLAVVTHAHIDHCGGLPALRAEAPFDVACHALSAEDLSHGGRGYSPGLTFHGKAMEVAARLWLPSARLGTAPADLMLADGDRLDAYGLPGSVVHTPGHTDGCISLLLDDGSAFVGDLVTGPDRNESRPTPPTMAADLGQVRESWQVLLDAGAKTVYPAHGQPFPAAALGELSRRSA